MTAIFANADWYRARPEPEHTWQGVLQPSDMPVGPNTRTTAFVLVTDDQALPIYAATVEHLLAPFVGQCVMVQAKLVDLRPDGFGQELWVAHLRRAAPATP